MPRVSVVYLLLMVALLIVSGTVGYRLIEDYSWLDSLYMTLMVLTTVGFGEVAPPSTAGKVYSMVLMLAGIGLMLFLLSVLAESVTRNLLDPRHARIERASTLISVLDDDAQNISVVLSARELGPGVRIVARASDARAAHKLRYAGADEAIDPHHLSGRRIAGLLLSPHLTAFLAAENDDHFRLEERSLPPEWAGRSVESVMHELDAVIVTVWRGDAPVLPRPSEALQAGDLLVLSLPPNARRG